MIEIKEIKKIYEDKVILNNITLNINKGEGVALIGLNGVGKTTLIKIILDLIKPDAGYISINNIEHLNFNSRNDVAFLPEKFTPLPYLKGKEFLEISLSYYNVKLDTKEAQELVLKLNLPNEILDKKISSYSKGMAQKLGLLFIILSKRNLWILDEPMSGLDINSRKELLSILYNHVAKGGTFLITSHLINDLDKVCNKIGIINEAELKFFGSFNEFNNLYSGINIEEKFLEVINNE